MGLFKCHTTNCNNTVDEALWCLTCLGMTQMYPCSTPKCPNKTRFFEGLCDSCFNGPIGSIPDIDAKCECGSASLGSSQHSHYCPLFQEKVK
jgi:hypothetical protein